MSLADIVGVGTLEPGSAPTARPAPDGLDGGALCAYRLTEKPGASEFPPRRLRRLGPAQAMALSVVKRALGGAVVGVNEDDRVGVCVGTAWAELGDELAFLERMIRMGEKAASPIKFANSVHNALASQIAMELGWQAENYTFTHSDTSFEAALGQAIRLFQLGRTTRGLVCGVDALTEFLEVRGRLLGLYRDRSEPLRPLADGPEHSGTLPGEGGAAFLLAAPSSGAERLAGIEAVAADGQGCAAACEHVAFLGQVAGDLDGVDLVLTGANGDCRLDPRYREVLDRLGAQTPAGVYRHRTGDYETSSALGLALAVQAVGGELPGGIRLVRGGSEKALSRVLLFHLGLGGSRSAVLVTR